MYGFCLTILTEIAEGEKDGMRARVLSVKCECVCVNVSIQKTSFQNNVEVLFIIDTPVSYTHLTLPTIYSV